MGIYGEVLGEDHWSHATVLLDLGISTRMMAQGALQHDGEENGKEEKNPTEDDEGFIYSPIDLSSS